MCSACMPVRSPIWQRDTQYNVDAIEKELIRPSAPTNKTPIHPHRTEYHNPGTMRCSHGQTDFWLDNPPIAAIPWRSISASPLRSQETQYAGRDLHNLGVATMNEEVFQHKWKTCPRIQTALRHSPLDGLGGVGGGDGELKLVAVRGPADFGGAAHDQVHDGVVIQRPLARQLLAQLLSLSQHQAPHHQAAPQKQHVRIAILSSDNFPAKQGMSCRQAALRGCHNPTPFLSRQIQARPKRGHGAQHSYRHPASRGTQVCMHVSSVLYIKDVGYCSCKAGRWKGLYTCGAGEDLQ